MRVTHVITRLVVGGAQENTIASVLGLRQKPELEVNLLAGPTTGPEGSLESRLQAVSPELLTIVPSLVRPVHPLKDFQARRQLEKIFRVTKPQIVHTHSGKAGILGRLAAARAGVPIIIHTIHGPSFGNFQGALANCIFTAAENYAARVTTHFIVVADAMKTNYLCAGIGQPRQYTKIFSGFAVEPFLNARNDFTFRRRIGFSPDDFVIGSVARLVPLKGHADLFSALKLLLPKCPQARVLLLGDGVLRSQLEALAANMGLADKIVFAGLVPPAEVPRFVGCMDCLAHLSSFPEGLPRALPQALAAGKPVIAYDFDGADEVCIDNETGFLIHTGEKDVVAQKLLQFANNTALRQRLGERGRQFVAINFPVEKMVEDQYTLYQKLAGNAGVSSASS